MCDTGSDLGALGGGILGFPLGGPLGMAAGAYGGSQLFGGGGGGGGGSGLSQQAQDYLNMLQAYGVGLPAQASLMEQYQPEFAGLNLQNIQDTLTGTAGQPGYLSMYANDVVPAITSATTAANTATRGANVADVANLGP